MAINLKLGSKEKTKKKGGFGTTGFVGKNQNKEVTVCIIKIFYALFRRLKWENHFGFADTMQSRREQGSQDAIWNRILFRKRVRFLFTVRFFKKKKSFANTLSIALFLFVFFPVILYNSIRILF